MIKAEARIVSLLTRIKTEPPLIAATITVLVYAIPALISIIFMGEVHLPAGFTKQTVVAPWYVLVAFAINLLVLFVLVSAPALKIKFHFIKMHNVMRLVLIFFYWSLSVLSIAIIEAKIGYVSMIFSNPALAIVSGGLLADEHLLLYFFLGISGLVSYAMIEKSDGAFIRTVGVVMSIIISVFYFFLGRREVALMTICFFVLAKRSKITRVQLYLLGIVGLVIVIFIMSLRLSDDGKRIYNLDSEELSPLSYSSYIIQENTIRNPLSGFYEASVFRPFLFSKSSIAVQYFENELGDPAATPVIGIAGVTYLYGFMIPLINVLMLGTLFRTIAVAFKKYKTPVLKIVMIYLTFKAFNLLRNGEFSILSLDISMFLALLSPALLTRFKSTSEI